MNRTDPLTVALRTLDPADARVHPAGPRAAADLATILATDPSDVRAPAPGSPTRRLALVGAAAAAVTAGLVALPALTGGDQAFATWRAAPAGMSAQEGADAAAACRARQADAAADAAEAEALAGAATAVAERRGTWTTVVLAGRDGFSALCVSDESAGPFREAMIGSVGTATDAVAPGPRDVVATDLGTGSIDAGVVSLAAGAVGSDVVGVVYRSPVHGPVAATTANGRFALWLPGDELEGAASDGVEVEATHRDGTTATVRLTLR